MKVGLTCGRLRERKERQRHFVGYSGTRIALVNYAVKAAVNWVGSY